MKQSEAARIPPLLAARQPRPTVEEATIEGTRMLVILGDEVDTVIRYNRNGGVDIPQLSSYRDVAESAAFADERLTKQRASGRVNTTGEGFEWPRNWKLADAKAAGKIWYARQNERKASPLFFGKRTVEFISASITQLPERYGALVSSDDNYLTHGGGISRLLWTAAGATLGEDVKRDSPKLRLGDVHATQAGDLAADWLLHAVTVDLDSNRGISTENPTALLRSVLITAENLGCASIAVPLLGTGEAKLSKDDAVEAFASAIKVWVAGPSALARIALVTLPTESDLLLKGRQLLADVISAEDLVRTLRSPFFELGSQWLSFSAIPIALRFYRTATLLEETLALAAHEIGLNAAKESGSVGRIIEGMAEKLGDKVAVRVREAWMLRNQLAHHRGPEEKGEGEALGPLNLAISAMFSRFGTGKTDRITSLDAPGLSLDTMLSAEPVSLQRSGFGGVPESVGSVMASPEVAVQANHVVGTEPIRQLRAFVDKALLGKKRQHFFQNLNSDDYAGPDDLRLLEFLIRVGDPADWLSNEFPYHMLQQELRERGRSPNTDDRRQLSHELLESMGFPIMRVFKGIGAVILELRNIQNEMLVPHAAYDGGVTRAARLLEYICHVLIRFLSYAAFDRAPDVLLRSTGKLRVDEELRNCTLGKLLELLQYLANQIEQDKDTISIQKFKSVLETKVPLPRDMQQLAAVRNSFAHYKDEPSASETLRLARARTFIKDAVLFATAVNGSGVGLFPIILRVHSITIDQWGRRTVVAYRDDGQRETIFTDQQLVAGHVYLMHPTTNPLRVDPLLVAAGKIWDEPARSIDDQVAE